MIADWGSPSGVGGGGWEGDDERVADESVGSATFKGGGRGRLCRVSPTSVCVTTPQLMSEGFALSLSLSCPP